MLLASAANATPQKSSALPPVPRVILVNITGSHIPQRVLLYGSQVNSASPLYVMQSNGLLKSGTASLLGLLATDPSIGHRGSGL